MAVAEDRALAGVRVIDLTHVLAGPYASYLLALLGADVVKLEAPGRLDPARGRGPDDALNAAGRGLTYQVQGAGKRSVLLDLAAPEGRAAFLRLVAGADVLVENFTPGTLDRLGIGWEVLEAANPRLILCAISGYGDAGPKVGFGAYDNTIQAAAGVVAQTEGVKPGLSFVDYGAGAMAALATVAALRARDRTGRGQRISVSMLETALAFMAPEAAAALHAPGVVRAKEPGLRMYATAEGTLMPGVFTPAQHRALGAVLEAAGRPVAGLCAVADWDDLWARAEELAEGLAAAFASTGAEAWVALLRAADLPAERVATLAEAVADAQVAARGFFAAPGAGEPLLPLAPFAMAGAPLRHGRRAPGAGEHTAEVLAEAGLGPEEIAHLVACGVAG
jgi:crotonobetainyl-CoA:carnitine CoA-transferase CaiB-like acyl-CoA transferase